MSILLIRSTKTERVKQYETKYASKYAAFFGDQVREQVRTSSVRPSSPNSRGTRPSTGKYAAFSQKQVHERPPLGGGVRTSTPYSIRENDRNRPETESGEVWNYAPAQSAEPRQAIPYARGTLNTTRGANTMRSTITTAEMDPARAIISLLVCRATTFASTATRPAPHTCGRVHRTHRTLASCRWPRAEWVMGEGPHALLSHCGRGLTVALYVTEADAETALAFLDRARCGHACNGSAWHELVNLPDHPAEASAWRRAS